MEGTDMLTCSLGSTPTKNQRKPEEGEGESKVNPDDKRKGG